MIAIYNILLSLLKWNIFYLLWLKKKKKKKKKKKRFNKVDPIHYFLMKIKIKEI